MRLDPLAMVTLEAYALARSIQHELRRWEIDTPTSPALAAEARKGASRCRMAATQLVAAAAQLHRIAEEATPR